MASREEQKKAAREEREAKAQDDAARDRRKRRLRMLAIALGAAVVVVVIAIVVSSSGSDKVKGGKQTGPADKISAVDTLLGTIPQKGLALGKPDAPVTLVEFADLRCPFCKAYTLNTFPMLVNKYVKAGKLRIEFRNFAILGPDSQTAARALEAAAKTNRAWQFIDLWYQNQGDEKTPYVTDAFITRIATGAGIAPVPIVKASHSGGIPPSAATANTEASKFGFNSTPSFLVGKTGQANQTLQVNDPSDPSGFTQAIDTALGGP